MAVSFFGGQNGTGARVWSTGKFVSTQPDQEQLRARIRELEAICTDVLVAGVDIGLPQHLLNQLWAAVGHGEVPHAFNVDLPPVPRRVADNVQPQKAVRAPMEIPDIPLSNNPLTTNADPARSPCRRNSSRSASRKRSASSTMIR